MSLDVAASPNDAAPIYILLHALAAGAFMFFLQTLALHATIETAWAWAIVFGLSAAGVAWHQSNR